MTYAHAPLTARLLGSLVPVMCPPEAWPLADAIVAHVGLTMGALPTPFRRALVTGLYGYDALALAWAPGRLRRAHQLPPDLAERYYLSWEHGPTPAHQQLAKGVGQLIKLGCYEQPAMQAALGYTPAAWIERVTRRRLEVYRDDIERQQAAILAPDPLRPPRPRRAEGA
ncbi:MAG: hypothetical protein R3B06_31425 [Kofleriaceae bacterium]